MLVHGALRGDPLLLYMHVLFPCSDLITNILQKKRFRRIPESRILHKTPNIAESSTIELHGQICPDVLWESARNATLRLAVPSKGHANITVGEKAPSRFFHEIFQLPDTRVASEKVHLAECLKAQSSDQYCEFFAINSTLTIVQFRYSRSHRCFQQQFDLLI